MPSHLLDNLEQCIIWGGKEWGIPRLFGQTQDNTAVDTCGEGRIIRGGGNVERGRRRLGGGYTVAPCAPESANQA